MKAIIINHGRLFTPTKDLIRAYCPKCFCVLKSTQTECTHCKTTKNIKHENKK